MEKQPSPVKNELRPVWDCVIEDMHRRNMDGAAKYGVKLQPHNGRDALQDAYEEVLDTSVYLKQRLIEDRDAAEDSDLKDAMEVMVNQLAAKPAGVRRNLNNMTFDEVDMLHAVIGVTTEAGELLDAFKKRIAYGNELNIDNVIEEMGDIEFYMELLRQGLGIKRKDVLKANMAKLRLRYPDFRWSQDRANNRDLEAEESAIKGAVDGNEDDIYTGFGDPNHDI